MQIALMGLISFAMVDRFSGLYLGIAADIEWSMAVFDPILQIPGAWFVPFLVFSLPFLVFPQSSSAVHRLLLLRSGSP